MTQRAPRHVPALTGLFWVAVGVVIIAVWQPPPAGWLYWVRGVIVAAPTLFGLDSLRTALFASDGQIRAMVDGDSETARQAHLELAPPGLFGTLGRALASRRFVLVVVIAAVSAFFFIENYIPPWGIVGNALRADVRLPGGFAFPYRWIGLTAVLVV